MVETREILITIPFTAEQLDELRAVAPSMKVRSLPVADGQTAPEDAWANAEVVYSFRALPTPEQAPNLKWIQFHLAGIDQQIDAPILNKSGLQATTLSGANAPQVAEHAMALMLALAHHVHYMLQDQARANWSTQRSERYQARELLNSTVGIVGYGSIGQRLARLLQPFNVRILASRRDVMAPASEAFQIDGQGDARAELVHRMYPGKAVGTMLKECDFVVVTVPLTDETRGMLGAKQLSALKPGGLLVDVSRGGVVDHAALVQALEKRQLGGAALDVFPEEPLPADSPLWEMNNVIISPHVAGLSPHYNARAFALFKENLRRYVAGDKLLNTIDLARGY
jgi:phosphoglycerate dehydrogenase-like enzyme